MSKIALTRAFANYTQQVYANTTEHYCHISKV